MNQSPRCFTVPPVFSLHDPDTDKTFPPPLVFSFVLHYTCECPLTDGYFSPRHPGMNDPRPRQSTLNRHNRHRSARDERLRGRRCSLPVHVTSTSSSPTALNHQRSFARFLLGPDASRTASWWVWHSPTETWATLSLLVAICLSRPHQPWAVLRGIASVHSDARCVAAWRQVA